MADTRWTPTPWEAIGKAVYAADGTEVVHACKGPLPSATARRIVRAVNSHDDLYEALKTLVDEIDAFQGPETRESWFGEYLRAADAALAKAREQEPTDD